MFFSLPTLDGAKPAFKRPVAGLSLPTSAYAPGLAGVQRAPTATRFTAASMREARVASAAAEPIELYSAKYYQMCAIGGILSCGLTHTGVVSLDLVKCRMQAHPGMYSGVMNGFSTIAREQGARGLVRGWVPTLIGYSMQGMCKFGFYEYFKRTYAVAAGEETAAKYQTLLFLAASASAEVIADVFLCPFEAVKVRVQTEKNFALRGLFDGWAAVTKAEGVNGLFKGLTPLWMRQVPYTMVKFGAFENTVRALYKHAVPKPKEECSKGEQLAVTFAAGYIAGVFCAIVSHPADTVVSKLNNMKTEGGNMAAIKTILGDLGFTGIWRGLGPRIIMIGTLTGAQWFIFDGFKASVGLPTSGGAAPKK